MSLSVWICLNCFANRSAALDVLAEDPVLLRDEDILATVFRVVWSTEQIRARFISCTASGWVVVVMVEELRHSGRT